MVISCVRGRVKLNFSLSLSVMRCPISGVKLMLYCFLLPRGMCALSVCVGDDGVEDKKLFCLLHE